MGKLIFGLLQCEMSSPATANHVPAPLPQGSPAFSSQCFIPNPYTYRLTWDTGAGYGILIGVGALFAFGMWGVAVLLAKFQNEVQGSEMFMTAKRSVGTGLIASAVVSGWTIAATLLTSTSWTYSYGVSGIHT